MASSEPRRHEERRRPRPYTVISATNTTDRQGNPIRVFMTREPGGSIGVRTKRLSTGPGTEGGKAVNTPPQPVKMCRSCGQVFTRKPSELTEPASHLTETDRQSPGFPLDRRLLLQAMEALQMGQQEFDYLFPGPERGQPPRSVMDTRRRAAMAWFLRNTPVIEGTDWRLSFPEIARLLRAPGHSTIVKLVRWHEARAHDLSTN